MSFPFQPAGRWNGSGPGERRDVRRRRAGQHAVDREGLEGPVGRPVHVVDPRRDRAVRIERLPQVPAGRRQVERRGRAEEWRLVRTGEDRPGDRKVRHLETPRRAFPSLRPLAGGEDVVAVDQTRDEPHQCVAARDLPEHRGDVVAVQIHSDVAERDGAGDFDAHQDVAAADHVVSSRESGDREVVAALLMVFLQQAELRLFRVGGGRPGQANQARSDHDQQRDRTKTRGHMPLRAGGPDAL